MGTSPSKRKSPSPVVEERHVRALYINVPISVEEAAKLTKAPCIPDVFEGSAWISICVDDLDVMKPYIGLGLFAPSMLTGWMTKVNLLVKAPAVDIPLHDVSEEGYVHGYQILSLHFESGFAGKVKRLGAISTQKVPTGLAEYDVSSGKSGETILSTMDPGQKYSARIRTGNTTLLDFCGQLAEPIGKRKKIHRVCHCATIQVSFAELARVRGDKGATPKACGSIREGTRSFRMSSERVKVVAHSYSDPASCAGNMLAIVSELGAEIGNKKCAPIAFLQERYELTDHKNTVIG